MTDPTDLNERHRQRMARKKALIDAAIARNHADKGLIVVTTGNGKGKSSSGFGMAARALGHGYKVGIVQFIKGAFPTGEEQFFRRFPDQVSFHVMGEGYTWDTQDRTRDIQKAEEGWAVAEAMLQDPGYQVVLLDELCVVLQLHYLETGRVIDALLARPEGQHVILTGRGAPDELIEVADTVSEMREVKHAYQAGIRAQPGIEF